MTDMDIDDFVELETKVWQALVDGDTEADSSLLSPDFLGVYPSGFAGRTDHVEQLIDGPSVTTFDVSEARIVDVAKSAVMLSYRADYRPVASGQAPRTETMYVSSLWCRRGDVWVNVFSQDTPAEPPSSG